MILIALGSNLPSRFGSPGETLTAAYAVLEKAGIAILKTSRFWLTAPVPVSDQPWFHNSIISVQTDLSPLKLMTLLHAIEHDFGRIREARNEARTLDLDIIAYNNEVIDRNGLHIPHPRLHERNFVLLPLIDIAADWVHPVTGKNLSAMLDLISDQDAKPVAA